MFYQNTDRIFKFIRYFCLFMGMRRVQVIQMFRVLPSRDRGLYCQVKDESLNGVCELGLLCNFHKNQKWSDFPVFRVRGSQDLFNKHTQSSLGPFQTLM